MKENEKIVVDLAKQIYMDLEPREIEKLAIDVMQEVANVEIIHEADTDGVKPDVSVLDKVNSLRKDEVVDYADKQLLFQNCEEVENDMFRIPKIV